MIVARETAWLSVGHRRDIDTALAGRLEAWGNRQLMAEVRRLAYRLDPHGFVDRAGRVKKDRRVSLRPAPDTMSVLNALLPVKQGVAVQASLTQHATALRAEGDERSKDQIMADTLVERITGQASAAATPIEVSLVMTDRSLLGADDEPAHIAAS